MCTAHSTLEHSLGAISAVDVFDGGEDANAERCVYGEWKRLDEISPTRPFAEKHASEVRPTDFVVFIYTRYSIR